VGLVGAEANAEENLKNESAINQISGSKINFIYG